MGAPVQGIFKTDEFPEQRIVTGVSITAGLKQHLIKLVFGILIFILPRCHRRDQSRA